MKWNGIVSQLPQRRIPTRFATANTPQAISSGLRRNQSVARMSHRLDRRLRAELLPEPPHTNVDDVRARIEVVTPDLRQKPLAADHLAGVLDEVVEQAKLAVRELRGVRADPCLATSDIEH